MLLVEFGIETFSGNYFLGDYGWFASSEIICLISVTKRGLLILIEFSVGFLSKI